MNDRLTLLSRSVGCATCISVKNVLNAAGITYRELDVDHDPEAARYLLKATDRRLPLLFDGEENVASGVQIIKELKNYAH